MPQQQRSQCWGLAMAIRRGSGLVKVDATKDVKMQSLAMVWRTKEVNLQSLAMAFGVVCARIHPKRP
eukprot:2519415-Amphidinium_carterae.1